MENTTTYSTLNKVFNLHIDGSYYDTYNLASGGGCLLDGDKVLHSFVDLLPSHIPFNFHEYFGLAHSLAKCLSLGIHNIDVQTDCLSLLQDIEKLRNGSTVSDTTLKVIQDLNILPMIDKFQSFQFKHVLRGQNKLADYLVGNFLDKHITTNKLVKLFNKNDKIYHNDSKFYHAPEKTITKSTLKNIKDQIVVFLMFDNISELKVKLLHYSHPDVNTLMKEHTITYSSKKWGDKVAKEFCSFIESLEIKEFRVSTLGTFQHKIFDYIRPHSEILYPSVSQALDSTYEKFDLISFSSLTDFTVKVKEVFEEEYKEFNSAKLIKCNKPKLSITCKQFLFLTLKTLGEQEDLAHKFLKEHEENQHLKDISHLPIEIIQKRIFDKFIGDIQEENLSLYLKKKEDFKVNGVKFKF